MRAEHDGVDLRQLVGSGAWVATSASDVTAAFMVTEHTCECFAAEFSDPVCKHRAMLRYRLGHLPMPVGQPPSLARRRRVAAGQAPLPELLEAA